MIFLLLIFIFVSAKKVQVEVHKYHIKDSKKYTIMVISIILILVLFDSVLLAQCGVFYWAIGKDTKVEEVPPYEELFIGGASFEFI